MSRGIVTSLSPHVFTNIAYPVDRELCSRNRDKAISCEPGIFDTSLRDGPKDPCYLSAMNSRWGFDLDMSAVRLMRRDGGHWHEVARENIDGPDIEERLMSMVALVENGADVQLFLPREQILYTDVKISSEKAARREIEAAMDGRTPYALNELEIDWILSGPGTARVAAIAVETLDEAAAFAEARGLGVAGFSSLADAEDFPRLPVFGGEDRWPDEEDEPAEAAPSVTFASVREPRQSEILTLSNSATASDGPVVRVDDPTPVMQVQSSSLPPLNPGAPLRQAPSAPRVRTDIAAGTLSGAAASLTPAGPSIKVRSAHSKSRHTAIVFVVAAVLTIGIAAIVWSILPMTPGRTTETPAEETETGLATEIDQTTDVLAEAPPVPDLPKPTITLAIPDLEAAPAADPQPTANSTEDVAIARTESRSLLSALPDTALPSQTLAALERRPNTLANLLTDAPIQGLDGAEDSAESTLEIYLASVERRDLAFDAIALPDASSLSKSALPQTGPAPDPFSETVALASADPTQPIEEESAAIGTAPDAVAIAAPVTPDPEAQTDVTIDGVEATDAPATLRPTALAAALPDRQPRPRPAKFVQEIERQTFGGRTRAELAELLPPPRPSSAQVVARQEQPSNAASELAVATSLAPRNRPRDFDAIVAAAQVQAKAEEMTASVDFDTPDTSAAIEAALAEDAEPEPRPQDSPRLAIPSTASVARQATVENAIPLNKINLVGVYGLPSDRRALVRLPSGRYVKVKVGDRVDGGTVAQINDSELIYRKGSRTVALSMPKG